MARVRAALVLLLAALGAPCAAQTSTGAPAAPFAPPKTVSLWQPGDPGERLNIIGRVTDPDGHPIAGAVVRVRQADGTGVYHSERYRATIVTAKDGGYSFDTVLPGNYGGVKHIHVYVTADGYAALATRIVFKGDANLDAATQREEGIFLDEADVKGEKVLFGRFDMVLHRGG